MERIQKNTFRKKVKVSECAFDRMKEAFEKVAKDVARKMSIVQEIMIRCTDYLRRIIAPAEGQGGVAMSYLCPHCSGFPTEDYVWWVSGDGEKSITNGGEKIRLEATTKRF